MTKPRDSSRRIFGLCCECGQVRTLQPNYMGRGDSVGSPLESARQLDAIQSRGHWLGIELYWRELRTLKCTTCDRWTRHALVYDGGPTCSHDPDELTNYAVDGQPGQ